MAIWEDVKKITLDLAHSTADLSKKIAEITKLNLNTARQEELIKNLYLEIGKQYYKEFGDAPGEGFGPLCEKISACRQTIDENDRQIAALKSSMKKGDAPIEADWTPAPCGAEEAEAPVPSAAEAAEVFESQPPPIGPAAEAGGEASAATDEPAPDDKPEEP